MTDPFYVLLLIDALGPDYIVWDKAATIRFRRPGRSTVRAEFVLSDERVAEIKAQLAREPKVEPTFTIEIKNLAGEVIAEVEKVLHIRRKDRALPT